MEQGLSPLTRMPMMGRSAKPEVVPRRCQPGVRGVLRAMVLYEVEAVRRVMAFAGVVEAM